MYGAGNERHHGDLTAADDDKREKHESRQKDEVQRASKWGSLDWANFVNGVEEAS